MDPNATLTRIRELAALAQLALLDADEQAELGELTEALDGWLTRGGFLPTDWNWRDAR